MNDELILGNLDGIQTGIRQLIRTAPLETQIVQTAQGSLTLPTPAEILRIKAALILRRNATRDYLDLAALSAYLGASQACAALLNLDALYRKTMARASFNNSSSNWLRPCRMTSM